MNKCDYEMLGGLNIIWKGFLSLKKIDISC